MPAPGSRFANPALAATYQRILDEAEAASQDRDEQIEAARRAYYEGFVAEAIAAYVASAEVMDVTGQPHRGLLSYADLAGWHPRLEEPLTYEFGGLTVCKTRPWGQGPVFLQQLALLDGFDLAAMGPGTADFIHTVTECGKLAFADREAWYGDPDFTDVPVKALLSAGYADERRRLVGPEASAELRPGAPDGRAPRLPDFVTARSPAPATTGAWRRSWTWSRPRGAGPGHRRADDAHQRPGPDRPRRATGPATPATSTWPTGSATWCPPRRAAAGCSPRRSSPASASASAPGRRCSPSPPGCPPPSRRASGRAPRSRPSLALRDREPYLAFGTPGGDQQDQWSLLFFLNHLTFGMNLQQAIDFPSFHSAHMPSSFYPRQAQPRALDVESRVGAPVIERTPPPRPPGQRPPRLVAGPGQRGGPPRRHPVRRRQPPRHAGLRRRPLTSRRPQRDIRHRATGPRRVTAPGMTHVMGGS